MRGHADASSSTTMNGPPRCRRRRQAWDALLDDDEALRGGVAITRRHGVALRDDWPATLRQLTRCRCTLTDDAVLKLYPPAGRARGSRPACSPSSTRGCRSPPRVLATGTQDWHYLLMSRLRGRRLVEVWPELDPRDRTRIASRPAPQSPALHASMHRRWAHFEPMWNAIAAQQRRTAIERQRARGLHHLVAGAHRRIPRRVDARPAGIRCCCAPRSCANT